MGSWRGGSAVALTVALCVGVACGKGADPETDPLGEAPIVGGDADAGGSLPDAAGHPPDGGQVPDAGNPPPPDPHRCSPTAGGPYWLTEGESLEVVVRCASGLAPAQLTVAPMPPGMRFEPASGTLRWTPGLAQAAVLNLTLRAGPEDTGALTVGVADAFWDPANARVADPAAYPAEYGVPVIFVQFSGTPSKDTVIPAQVTYRGRTWTNAGLKLHGVTSLEFPKNSYGLRFPDADPFADPDKGFLNRTKIRLTETFDDNSYVRQRLAYALWNRMDPAHVQVGIYSVVVFLNGRYWGLYALSDDVDKGLLRMSGLNKDGNLYKAKSNDANFDPLDASDVNPRPKETPHQGYEKKEGLPPEGMPGAFADLDEFLTWIYGADAASFRSGFPERAVQSEFEDFWIFVSALIAGDNSRKNYYLFHDPAGPWRYVPWDLNGTLGQTWRTLRERPRVTTYAWDNGLFARFLGDPAIADPLRARYGRLLRNAWEIGEVLALFDAMTAEVHAAALRDERKWGAAYRSYPLWSERTDFLDHEGEVAYVRRWLIDQWAVLRAKYP